MPDHPEGFLRLVKEAKTRIKEEDYRDIKKKLDAGEPIIIIDTREDNEWARGHIPNAVHLGKGVIERDIEKAIPDKDATLVLYCGGGYRSALAADNLQKMGYRNVISMEGGWRGWPSGRCHTRAEHELFGKSTGYGARFFGHRESIRASLTRKDTAERLPAQISLQNSCYRSPQGEIPNR